MSAVKKWAVEIDGAPSNVVIQAENAVRAAEYGAAILWPDLDRDECEIRVQEKGTSAWRTFTVDREIDVTYMATEEHDDSEEDE